MSAPRFQPDVVPSTARQQSPYWGEHVARYAFATSHLANCRVLDIACGAGYGMPMLQAQAQFVVGVDVEWDAVKKARAEITNGTASVIMADGCLLPFGAASFDAVTSFETLEHLEQRPQFLAELRRVLKPAGVCILSTPNANYTMPVNGKPTNPFHVYEYTPAELLAELQKQFVVAELFGQRLDERFTIPPFWDAQRRLPRTPGIQAQLYFWKALNKLPVTWREGFSQAWWGRPFYPAETDYRFEPTMVETAPVLVAICHPKAVEGN